MTKDWLDEDWVTRQCWKHGGEAFYAGPAQHQTVDKVVWHSTETGTWPGYKGGAQAPTITVEPLSGATRQHVPFSRGARALEFSSDAGWTNTGGVAQIEIIGSCDRDFATKWGYTYLPDLDDKAKANLARLLLAIVKACPAVPLTSTVEWVPYPKSYGARAGQRLGYRPYLAYKGSLGHQHAPANSHGDPGSLDMAGILRIANGGGGATKPSKEESLMSVTSNGWPARSSYAASFTAPNGHSCPVVNRSMAIVFAYTGWRLDTEVAHITSAYGARTLQQQISLYRQKGLTPILDSNHVSGTAVDMAKPGVQYERDQRGAYRSGYGRAQEARIRKICRDTGVLQWGGDFGVGYRDPVHYQLVQNLGSRYRRVVTSVKLRTEANRLARFVSAVQQAVGVKADGIAGPGTIAAVKRFQSSKGLTPDGIWGAKSRAAAGGKTPPKKKPSPAKPTPSKAKTVARGDRGAAVKVLQRQVGVKPDGIFGTGTEAAVKATQKRVGVTPDGRWGAGSKVAYRAFVDGRLGRNTVTVWQENAGTPVDGLISRPSTLIEKVQRVDSKRSSVQPKYRLTGKEIDGYLGSNTWKMLQDMWGFTGRAIDGIPGKKTIKALQRMVLRGRY